ncbi:MAG: phenylalanine--tRNA ligase beta subunit-related protein [Methanomicrobiaceae archaeon]|nr:phenylalanine--tRNA ligase beta subunit-related protein [Methanomicrobiaceae archaeon]
MQFSRELLDDFPGISVVEGVVRSVDNDGSHPDLEALKETVARELQSRYTLEEVRNDPVFRAYRDFFWRVGVDPTKTRPASEALVRRILAGRSLPAISTAVDAYNLASASSGIPIAAFDADLLEGVLSLRFANGGEEFFGIGMDAPVILRENQVVMTDANGIIAIYPYRDADATKVTLSTKNIHIISCGVPGIEEERIIDAYRTCARYLEEFTGGTDLGPQIFP